MPKLYTKKTSLIKSIREPKKDTITTILNYSKMQHVVELKGMTIVVSKN